MGIERKILRPGEWRESRKKSGCRLQTPAQAKYKEFLLYRDEVEEAISAAEAFPAGPGTLSQRTQYVQMAQCSGRHLDELTVLCENSAI